MMKNFLRFGGDPVRWRNAWLRELGMHKHDWTATDVTMSTRSLHYFGTYDQLNIPCLAGVEVFCPLIQLVEAYASGDCSKPNYNGVKHITA